MVKKLKDLCFKHNVELTKWKDTSPESSTNSWEVCDDGKSMVANSCLFMKPSVGIKAVWDEFNSFLPDYTQRLEYVLTESLKQAQLESDAKQKEKMAFTELLTTLKG
jgi:hypothetical protein